MLDNLINLTPHQGVTLQAQLRQKLVEAILDGYVPPASPLPSCRRLAKHLGVARNTVVLAYQDLVDEGFLISKERSGYFVNQDMLAGRAATTAGAPSANAGPDWRARLAVSMAGQRNVVKPENWQDYDYPFIYGQFDPALFPIAEWRECSRQALGIAAVRDWARDNTNDDPALVEQIRTRVLARRGVRATADEILVTVGAQHALYLLAELLIQPDSRVGIEDPGYADARNIFSLKTSRFVPLKVDDEGLVDGGHLDPCDYVYVTPSHQYPTTATLSLDRRQTLLRRAQEKDLVFIEDDYESELNHVGEPKPALKSLDDGGRVIFVASLSKTLAPGLRLGFMVGPADLIAEARALRRLMVRHPPANNQRTIALFLTRGHHDSLMRRLSHAYRDRWEVMRRALAKHLPTCSFVETTGGTSVWVEGPAALDAGQLEKAAAADGVVIEPGDVHFMGPRPPRNYFRLGFSSITVDRIEPGLKRLGKLIDEQLNEKARS
jgi:GntR family transcriptional regulator/MocR family aminotransferase